MVRSQRGKNSGGSNLEDALHKQNSEHPANAPKELGDWREYGSRPRPIKKDKDRALPLRNPSRG